MPAQGDANRSRNLVSRRKVLVLPAVLAIPSVVTGAHADTSDTRPLTGATEPQAAVIRASVAPDNARPFERRDFGTVGIYDIDLLTRPDFSVLLDNLAASPRAFHGARFFGLFTAGVAESLQPESGGSVWDDPAQEPDFTTMFDALQVLTSRGLTPFVAFGFFPPAVSPSPVTPASGVGQLAAADPGVLRGAGRRRPIRPGGDRRVVVRGLERAQRGAPSGWGPSGSTTTSTGRRRRRSRQRDSRSGSAGRRSPTSRRRTRTSGSPGWAGS